ncbi:MAG: nucleoside hydrolase, partial [Anaerolineales bacterium]|nr:nucleoside hydrolase [Anaerolineales bacterium]
DFIGQILPHYMGFYKQSTGLDGLYVHDSSALAYVIDPSLFTTRHLYVHVETASPVNFGHTTADWRLNPAEEPNVHVCVDVDHERFLNLYQQRLMEA